MIKKILILLPNDKLGGAEQHLKNVTSYFLSKEYEVDVYFLKKETGGQWRGMSEKLNLFFTRQRRESFGVISLLIKLLQNRSQNYEYLFTSHAHLNFFAGLLIRCGIIKKKYFIGRESTSVFKRFTGGKLFLFRILYKIGYGKLDLLICQTNYMKHQLVEALPKLVSKINIQVIPNPIDLENIKLDDIDFNLKNQNYIVSAGRLISVKGFDILIRAFASIKNKFPDMKLVILGEGSERTALELLAKEIGVIDDVLLLGFKKNVYTYFKFARACVVSSRIEGFPNVLLQMMSQNNTVISTLCAGGIDEIPSIYTCEPDNAKSLAYKIEQSLTNDTSANRGIFDDFLAKRSIQAFIRQVNQYLND